MKSVIPVIKGTRGRGRSSVSVEEREKFTSLVMQVVTESEFPVSVANVAHYIDLFEKEQIPRSISKGGYERLYDLCWSAMIRLHKQGVLTTTTGKGIRKSVITMYQVAAQK